MTPIIALCAPTPNNFWNACGRCPRVARPQCALTPQHCQMSWLWRRAGPEWLSMGLMRLRYGERKAIVEAEDWEEPASLSSIARLAAMIAKRTAIARIKGIAIHMTHNHRRRLMSRSALSARRSALKRVIGIFHAAHLPKIPAIISSRLPRMLKFRSPDESSTPLATALSIRSSHSLRVIALPLAVAPASSCARSCSRRYDGRGGRTCLRRPESQYLNSVSLSSASRPRRCHFLR